MNSNEALWLLRSGQVLTEGERESIAEVLTRKSHALDAAHRTLSQERLTSFEASRSAREWSRNWKRFAKRLRVSLNATREGSKKLINDLADEAAYLKATRESFARENRLLRIAWGYRLREVAEVLELGRNFPGSEKYPAEWHEGFEAAARSWLRGSIDEVAMEASGYEGSGRP